MQVVFKLLSLHFLKTNFVKYLLFFILLVEGVNILVH